MSICKNSLLFIFFLYLAFKFPPYSLETDWYNFISIINILELILGIFVLKLEISRKLRVVVTSYNGSMVWHVVGQIGKFEDLWFDPKCTRMVKYNPLSDLKILGARSTLFKPSHFSKNTRFCEQTLLVLRFFSNWGSKLIRTPLM